MTVEKFSVAWPGRCRRRRDDLVRAGRSCRQDRSRSATFRPRAGRWRRSRRRTTSCLASSEGGQGRPETGISDLSGRSHHQGQPVQSKSRRRGTKELITRDNVGLIVVGATPETNNPVSTQCELEQIPCISSVAPWQTNFIARQANPGDPKTLEAVRLHVPLFLGTGRRHRGLHRDVESGLHQQIGRRAVSQ